MCPHQTSPSGYLPWPPAPRPPPSSTQLQWRAMNPVPSLVLGVVHTVQQLWARLVAPWQHPAWCRLGVGACVFNCLHVLNCVLRIGDRSVELPSPSFPLLYVRATSVQKGQCYCLHELGSTTSRPAVFWEKFIAGPQRKTYISSTNLEFLICLICHMFFGLWEEAE